MKVIIFRKMWPQMSSVSGYDPLYAAIKGMPDVRVQDFIAKHVVRRSFQARVLQYFVRKYHRLGLAPVPICKPPHPMVDLQSEAIGEQIISAAEKDPDSFIYLMAGETQLGLTFSETDQSIRKRTAICLHQPASYLRLNYRDFSAFEGLGAIVCLSTEQKAFIESICSTPVILSRHGVCQDFFKPGETKSGVDKANLLFVGEWLRDFEGLYTAMKKIWEAAPETTLDCVLRHSARIHPALLRLARDGRVRWHADISQEALRGLYQNSTLLFLPLVDAAANNAISEALSCGLPIITSRVGAVSDYVGPEFGELCPPDDVSAHVEAALRWLPDQTRRIAAGLAGRKFAEEKLNWQTIAGDLINELQAKGLCH